MKTRDDIVISKYLGIQRAAVSEALLEEDFDDLVFRASDGDRRAIGAIAIAFNGIFRLEAETVLQEFGGDASKVVQDFLHFLAEAKAPFNRAGGPALQWMRGIVRMIAHQCRMERIRNRRVLNHASG